MKILVVDDEKLSRLNIIHQIDNRFVVMESSNFEDAKQKLENFKFDICYIDLKLGESNDLEGLKLIPIAEQKGIYTVVMTSIEDEHIAEKAYELGCRDVYNKGSEKIHISETIARYLLTKDNFTEEYFFKELIKTQNKRYQQELKKLIKIIPTDIPLTILGESGTGKSHLAGAIHEISKRPGNFVAINCSAFSGDTLKSELFGHTKGSFTGATSDSVGKLQLADNGTIFFDEIGSMPSEMQEQLLKAIEEKSFYPVGGSKLVKSDFRIICATLDDLPSLVKAGKFRFDLYQRISGYTFTQPSLKDRKEDIIPMLKNALSSSRRVIIKEDVQKEILSYDWPGNIRELNRFADVLSYSGSGIIKVEDVQDYISKSVKKDESKLIEEYQFELIQKIGLREFIELISKNAVSKALEMNKGVATKAISDLKISSSTFYKYFKNEGYHATH